MSIARELLSIPYKSTPLHGFNALYFKLFLLALTISSRLAGAPVVVATLAINTLLLMYVGARRLYATLLAIWLVASAVLMALNALLGTLTQDVALNLAYGFNTFTGFSLFYLTTPPRHLKKLVGFNVFSIAYSSLGYSIKLVAELVDVLRARGWDYSANAYKHIYVLRTFAALLVARIEECVDALKARGADE